MAFFAFVATLFLASLALALLPFVLALALTLTFSFASILAFAEVFGFLVAGFELALLFTTAPAGAALDLDLDLDEIDFVNFFFGSILVTFDLVDIFVAVLAIVFGLSNLTLIVTFKSSLPLFNLIGPDGPFG